MIYGETVALEDNLQRQLHVERFSRPKARSTVPVADGVRSDSKAAAIGPAWRRQVCTVEEVEHFDSELRADAFCNLRVLHDGEIHRGITRPVKGVASTISQCSGSRIGKGSWIEPRYTSFVECMRNAGVGIADQVGTLFTFTCTRRVLRGKHTERLSGMER